MELRGRRWRWCLPACLVACRLLVSLPGAAAQTAPDWAQLKPAAFSVLRHYLRINTTNPPGHEAEGAIYLASVLRRYGIRAQIIPIVPGRSAVYARLRGDGSQRPLLLISHIDVVPAVARNWRSPPFAADIVDGELYARGSIDTKSLGIEELFSLVALKQTHARLRRDVIFMATPDEESGSRWGMGWIVRHRPDLLAHVQYALNEGGGVEQFEGRHLVTIEVTQKVPLWLRVIAVGEARHAAVPPPDDAVTRLLDALDGVRRIQLEPEVVPQVRLMLHTMAPFMKDKRLRQGFRHPGLAIHREEFWQALEARPDFPWLNALFRTTVAITRLRGSRHINSIPTDATADLDCRLLPGQSQEALLQRIRQAVQQNGQVRVKVLLKGQDGGASPIGSAFYRAIAAAARQAWPDAVILPAMSPGFTDSRFLRARGIECYGWDAVSLTQAESGGAHADNERIRPQAFERALPVLYAAVQQVAEK